MSSSDDLRTFKALVTTVQQLGGELGVEASCVREQLDNDETIMDANNPSEAEQTCARNAACSITTNVPLGSGSWGLVRLN